ncbi:sigma-70 family RNA polymerase sigma factor [Alkalihalobacillus sp. LMS39]|uniref:sigma-70 family RNA polymerase sigma factor n=1 Tax=Alkalihalobacillus sp. LMS39 TaxID=2924032 RepID=UPI001FB463EC|nr:sigma-70 family RNA polymerase sigma factor [Alkalihalobacillus sp. LMS39]UOE96012.1 sigma-70 family RNA polymerase sigma factor [Alkalihalobacillus sp. LMS39]
METDMLRLVKKAQKGNKEAFVSLIKQNESLLYRVARSILQNDNDCLDAIQETILKAYQNIETVREPKYFKTWIVRIVMNECYSMQTLKRKVVPLEKTEEPSFKDTTSETMIIHEAIDSLHEDFRRVIMLFYFEDLSIKDIASLLEIPESTVKTRLHRARNQLDTWLTNTDKGGCSNG